jgi:hypothetical protein
MYINFSTPQYLYYTLLSILNATKRYGLSPDSLSRRMYPKSVIDSVGHAFNEYGIN